jgi:hypothetical protein
MEVRQHNSYFKKNRIYSEQHVSAFAIVRFQFAQLMLSGREVVWGPDGEISLSAKHKWVVYITFRCPSGSAVTILEVSVGSYLYTLYEEHEELSTFYYCRRHQKVIIAPSLTETASDR